MPRAMTAKYRGRCKHCGDGITVGSEIIWSRADGAVHPGCYDAFYDAKMEARYGDGNDAEYAMVAAEMRADDAEYARGYNDTRNAQMMGPPGSAAREAAYLAMEAQWAREGFDG